MSRLELNVNKQLKELQKKIGRWQRRFRCCDRLIMILLFFHFLNCSSESIKFSDLSNATPHTIGTISIKEPPRPLILNYDVNLQIGQFKLSNKLPLALDHNNRLRYYYIEHVKIEDQKENLGYIEFNFKKNIWDYNRLYIMGHQIRGTIGFSILDGCYRFKSFYVDNGTVQGHIDYESNEEAFYFKDFSIDDVKISGHLKFEPQTGKFHLKSFRLNKHKLAGYIDTDGPFNFDYNIYSEGELNRFENKRFVALVLILFPIFVDFQYEVGGIDISSQRYNKYKHHPTIDSGCMGWSKKLSNSCYKSCIKTCNSSLKKSCELEGCQKGCNEVQCNYAASITKANTDKYEYNINIQVISSICFLIIYFSLKKYILIITSQVMKRLTITCKKLSSFVTSILRKW
jgi:hypothetical protein